MTSLKKSINYNTDQVMQDFVFTVVDIFDSYDDRDSNAVLPDMIAFYEV